MSFRAPVWLLVLLAVAALIGLYVVRQLRPHPYVVRCTNTALLAALTPRRTAWRRHVASGLVVLALGTLVISLAGPIAKASMPRNQVTVMLALDVSLSMQATDIEPTRFRAVQAAAEQFVDLLPTPINLGLVSFSGTATTLAAPTTDRARVRHAIDRLQLDEFTAIGEAVFTCLTDIHAFQTARSAPTKAPPARIVLLSDGYDTGGRSTDQASAAAEAAHVPVSTIAFGTDSGIVSLQGMSVHVPVDHATLHRIADSTGGSYTAAASARELSQAYSNLGRLIGYTSRPQDISAWFVRTGVLLALLGTVLNLIWASRLL